MWKFRWRHKLSERRRLNGVFDCVKTMERIQARINAAHSEVQRLTKTQTADSVNRAEALNRKTDRLLDHARRVQDIQAAWYSKVARPNETGAGMKERISTHEDDPWADTIILNGIRSLRLIIRERYKTSDLSGDEWRFGYMWQVLGSEWTDLDGSYGSQDAAIAAFFPAFRTSHQDWHDNICNSTQFIWKGQPLIEMSDDGKPMSLLHAIGCLSWAMRAGRSDYQWKKNDSNVCAQPGCVGKPVSLYRMIAEYHRRIGVTREYYDGKSYRRFCKKHLRRGDCGLEDADCNYELVEGIGPDGNEPASDVVSPSSFGGVIGL